MKMPTVSSKFESSSVLLLAHLFVIVIIFSFFVVSSSSSSDLSVRHDLGRGLKSFKEKAASDTNVTLECSPSGPCVPCLYSEKKEERYRCSETGYRIPMKCVKMKTGDEEKQKLEEFVTYRSCIPAVNDDTLSVIGFEGIMLVLLGTSLFVIMKRKGSLITPGGGAIRLPTNPRF